MILTNLTLQKSRSYIYSQGRGGVRKGKASFLFFGKGPKDPLSTDPHVNVSWPHAPFYTIIFLTTLLWATSYAFWFGYLSCIYVDWQLYFWELQEIFIGLTFGKKICISMGQKCDRKMILLVKVLWIHHGQLKITISPNGLPLYKAK